MATDRPHPPAPPPCTPDILDKIVKDEDGYSEYPSRPYDEVYEDIYISDR